jgi:hypothetical protein
LDSPAPRRCDSVVYATFQQKRFILQTEPATFARAGNQIWPQPQRHPKTLPTTPLRNVKMISRH